MTGRRLLFFPLCAIVALASCRGGVGESGGSSLSAVVSSAPSSFTRTPASTTSAARPGDAPCSLADSLKPDLTREVKDPPEAARYLLSYAELSDITGCRMGWNNSQSRPKRLEWHYTTPEECEAALVPGSPSLFDAAGSAFVGVRYASKVNSYGIAEWSVLQIVGVFQSSGVARTRFQEFSDLLQRCSAKPFKVTRSHSGSGSYTEQVTIAKKGAAEIRWSLDNSGGGGDVVCPIGGVVKGAVVVVFQTCHSDTPWDKFFDAARKKVPG